ncbi:hypothetical protein KZ870_35345, partial [Pseudomonas aeruginosa]|nr:hypothetical protein [Pseudomonas aeruginosa]
VIGAGGILVELLRDSRSLLLPTTDAAIRDALLSLRSAPLLSGSTCAKAWPGTRRNWSSSVCCWSAWQARRWPS